MSKLDDSITIDYHNNRYTIVLINHANIKLPILLDRQIYKIIKKLDKTWYVNNLNHIYCYYTKDDCQSQIYIHDLVLKINSKFEFVKTDSNIYYPNKPINHINRINFDNRVENLQYDTPDKDHNKNIKKKKRTIDLDKFGIDVDELPTYIWYLKPDTTHGSRFVVQIQGDITWKTTSSKKVSLRYKLEEAKKYLKYIKKSRPELFTMYSMNGDLTARGSELLKEFNTIIQQAGYSMELPDKKTDQFLKEDSTGLSEFEIYLLHSFDPQFNATVDIIKAVKEFTGNK